MRELMSFVEIDGAAAGSIVVGMREMALADGREHPREMAMIAMLEADLDSAQTDKVDVGSLKDRGQQEAFLKSLALVALSDGALKPEESALLHQYGAAMGHSEADVATVLHDVATFMLSTFTGVTVFREQAVQIGRSLGLDDDAIRAVLDAD